MNEKEFFSYLSFWRWVLDEGLSKCAQLWDVMITDNILEMSSLFIQNDRTPTFQNQVWCGLFLDFDPLLSNLCRKTQLAQDGIHKSVMAVFRKNWLKLLIL